MKLPLMPHRKDKPHPEDSIVIQQQKLARNSLVEFRIGFEAEEFRSVRDIRNLIHVIDNQYSQILAVDKISFLESIRIGWKLPSFAVGPVLQGVVPLLLRPPAKIKRLQIMVNAPIPLPILESIITRTTLETLDLQWLRIRTQKNIGKPPAPRESQSSHRRFKSSVSPLVSSSSGNTKTKTSGNPAHDDVIVADENVLYILPYLPPTVTTLKLNDCNMQVHHIPKLIELLRKKLHVQVLSLRLNRSLYMNGWENKFLDKLPYLKALDLSICDLDTVDGMKLTAALAGHPNGKLECLNVAGNYRMREAIPDLVKVCSRVGVMELDCSFCDVQNKEQQEVFDLLATEQQSSIRSLAMRSAHIENARPLIRCIQQNTSLERLILDHPRSPSPLTPTTMDKILGAIRNNYYLQVFQVDTAWNQDPKVLQEMEHWMTLNRCGRSILIHDKGRHWSHVLGRVGKLNDIDTFYWFLRSGAEQFAVM